MISSDEGVPTAPPAETTETSDSATAATTVAPPRDRRERRREDRRRGRLIGRFMGEPPHEGLVHLPHARIDSAPDITAIAAVGLLIIAVFYTLYFARAVLIPFTTAVLLGFLLAPLIRLLRKVGIPEMLGTIIVFVTFIGTLGLTTWLLAPAARSWLATLPENAEQAEERLRDLIESFGQVREAVDEVAQVSAEAQEAGPAEPDVVRVAPEPLSNRILGSIRSFVVGAAGTVFLLFLLLASGEAFLRRTVSMLPTLDQKKKVVRISHGIERDLSIYLITTSIINFGLGIAVGFALYLIGLPNPVLWGVIVAVLNYVPYLGGLVGVIMIALVALASIEDTTRALMAPASYLLLNALEAYVITPQIMGRRFSLNPVAVFVAVIFWGWIWGIPGTLLAVPLLTAMSIVCSNIESLRPVAVYLQGE